MFGALLEQARDDNKSILDDGGYKTIITITTRAGITPIVNVEIPATITHHNTQIDPETGVFASIRTAHCVFNLQTLVDAGFPVYVGKIQNEPDIKDSIIEFTDASGKAKKFRAIEPRPSHTFGCVSVTLGGAK